MPKKLTQEQAVDIAKGVGLRPLEPYTGSSTPWRCEHIACGNVVTPRLDTIRRRNSPCCTTCGHKENRRKQLGDEASAVEVMLSKSLKPLVDYPGFGRPWKCECLQCGRIVQPHFSSIKAGRNGCAYCSARKVDPDDAVSFMLSMELQPLVPYPGSKTNWKCRCMKCDKEVYPNYGDIKQGDGGCKYCGGKYVDPQSAVELMLVSDLIPQVAYVNSITKWHCLCTKCGRDVFPTYDTIRGGHSGCKYCSGNFVDSKEAEIFLRERGLEPLVPFPGSKKPWKSKCMKCGKVVSPTHGSLRSGNGSCAYCARKVVDPEDARNFMVSKGLEPLEPYSRADAPWPCRCLICGRDVSPSYSAIGSGQGGCKYCARHGIDYELPAHLYLMTHPVHRAHKVGIANNRAQNNRVREHQRKGWILFKTMDFESGSRAEEIEQKVLSWIRVEMNMPHFLSRIEMPRGGFTETVNADELDLTSIWAKVEAFSGRTRGARERMKNGEK